MYGFVDKRQKDLYIDRVRMQREGYRDGRLEFPKVKDIHPKRTLNNAYAELQIQIMEIHHEQIINL